MVKIKNDLFHKTIGEKLAEVTTIGPLIAADANADVAATGAALIAENGVLNQKNIDNTMAQMAALASTKALMDEENTWNESYKAASAKMMEKYPNNPEKWKASGFKTGAAKTPTVAPGKVLNVSVTTTISSTVNDVHWDTLTGAKIYKKQVCTGDPTIEANWHADTPDDVAFQSHSTVTVVPNVTNWVRIAGSNGIGQGEWSNPAKASA